MSSHCPQSKLLIKGPVEVENKIVSFKDIYQVTGTILFFATAVSVEKIT